MERYKGDPRVQAHGPDFSKILLGDDVVDDWEKYIDLIADSVYLNSGRGCINCSGVWASRHTEEIAEALAEKIGPVEALPPEDPKAGLAAFTVPGVAQAVWKMIEADLKESGVKHDTSRLRAAAGRDWNAAPTCGRWSSIANRRSSDRQEGVHVPVRDRGQVPAREDA